MNKTFQKSTNFSILFKFSVLIQKQVKINCTLNPNLFLLIHLSICLLWLVWFLRFMAYQPSWVI